MPNCAEPMDRCSDRRERLQTRDAGTTPDSKIKSPKISKNRFKTARHHRSEHKAPKNYAPS
jgi:hypothetical protein